MRESDSEFNVKLDILPLRGLHRSVGQTTDSNEQLSIAARSKKNNGEQVNK